LREYKLYETKLIPPTKEEDAAITAAALTDPDNPPLTDEVLVHFKRKRGQRGPNKNPTKVPLSIRVNPEVLERFKATGNSWQTRMSDELERAAERLPPAG
jgi:uncharacterized protein (DUF4415 family)